MGPCLRKLLTSQDEQDDPITECIAPIAEVSRYSAASASALVITHSHYFKFSAIAVGEKKNNAALL